MSKYIEEEAKKWEKEFLRQLLYNLLLSPATRNSN